MCGIPEEFEIERARACHLARASIGPSTLWGQGALNLNEIRDALRKIDIFQLSEIHTCNKFREWLDEQTNALATKFTRAADGWNWGAARKVINIYLLNLSMDYLLRDFIGIKRMEHWLEVPLDSFVVKYIHNNATEEERENLVMPFKFRIKNLNFDDSRNFQSTAQKIAQRAGVSRAALDFFAWGQRDN
jgi:hypothetical protein